MCFTGDAYFLASTACFRADKQYYDELERQKGRLGSFCTDLRPAGSGHAMKPAPERRTHLKQPAPVAVLTATDFVDKEDIQDLPEYQNNNNETKECKAEACHDENAADKLSTTTDGRAAVESPDHLMPEEPESPSVNLGYEEQRQLLHSDSVKLGSREIGIGKQGIEDIVRGYVDIAHALLRHFEEALRAKQRLTLGSLQCAEIVCNALEGLQYGNPRIALLVERISTAIALLHKRKLSDERDAGARNIVLNDDFKQDEATFNNGPPYSYQILPSQRCNSSGPHKRVGRTTRVDAETAKESRTSPSVAPRYMPRVEKDPTCSACLSPGPSRPSGNLSTAAFSELSGLSIGPPYLSEAKPGQPSGRLVRKGIVSGTDAPSSKGEKGLPGGSEVTKPWDDADERNDRNLSGTRGFLREGQVEPSQPKHVIGGVLEPYTGKPCGTLNIHTGATSGARGPSRTRLVASRDEIRNADGYQQTKFAGSVAFGECEGEVLVRPLVLCDTLTLSDEGHSQQEDVNGAILEEALSLVKCATDLIVSGEGPGYVEKQFFRYCRSTDAITATEDSQIPRGVTVAQGKYILLRHAIAVVEAEHGCSEAARDPNLYLRDLRRMKEILLGVGTSSQTKVDTSAEDTSTSKASESSHLLQERSPEERMERRLPLTILNLPVGYHPPEARRLGSPPPVIRDVSSELPRLSSYESHQSRSSFTNSGNWVHASSTAHRPTLGDPFERSPSRPHLPKPALELGETERMYRHGVEPSEQPLASVHGTSASQSMNLKSGFSSKHFLKARKSSFPSLHSREAQGEVTGNSLSTSHQPSGAHILLPVSNQSNQPRLSNDNAIESFKDARCLKASLSTASQWSADADRGGSLRPVSKAMFPSTAAEGLPPSEVDGIKLSTRSVIRDSTSGAVNSRMLEAPRTPVEPPVISMATSFALRNVSASRALRSSLPQIPEE